MSHRRPRRPYPHAYRHESPGKPLVLSHIAGFLAGGCATVGLTIGLTDLPSGTGLFSSFMGFLIGPMVGISLCIGWFCLHNYAAFADEIDRQTKAVVLSILLTALGCATSALFLVSIIGGAESVAIHQRFYLAHLNLNIQKITDYAGQEQKLIAAATVGESGLRSLADAESNGNGPTKRRGNGPAHSVYVAAADALRVAGSNLQAAARARDDDIAEAQKSIDKANDAIIAQDASEFEKNAAEAANLIRAAASINLAGMTDGLGLGLVSMPVTSQTFADIHVISDAIAKKRQTYAVPSYEPITARAAVRKYPPIASWIIALAIEGLPLFMTAILLAVGRKDDDDNDHEAGLQPVPMAPRPLRGRPALTTVK